MFIVELHYSSTAIWYFRHDAVYVYCTATFCGVSDASARCTQACLSPAIVGRAVTGIDVRRSQRNTVLYYV